MFCMCFILLSCYLKSTGLILVVVVIMLIVLVVAIASATVLVVVLVVIVVVIHFLEETIEYSLCGQIVTKI